MVRVFQTRPDNCWPAVLASMLEIPIEEVDHCSFVTGSIRFNATQSFLSQRGLFYIEFAMEPPYLPFSEIPQGALVIVGTHGRNKEHAAIARVYHVSGLMGFEIAHDPDPNSEMKSEDIRRAILLCRLDQLIRNP